MFIEAFCVLAMVLNSWEEISFHLIIPKILLKYFLPGLRQIQYITGGGGDKPSVKTHRFLTINTISFCIFLIRVRIHIFHFVHSNI